MKSLMPWVCLVAAAASQQVIADEFSAYRLGHYNQALEPLMNQSGKNRVADYYLGRIYLYGYGQLKNTPLAMRYFTQSARKGYLPAMQLLARYALLHEKNPQEAVTWFKQAAAAGDVDAQMFMAAAYRYGLGVAKNNDASKRYYIDAAKQGNSIAQYTIAENFLDTRHAGNNRLGIIWLTKSAANGNAQALTKLGSFYLFGKYVDKNVEKGTALLNQAVAQGYAPAMVKLGEFALANEQKQEAMEWFDKATNYRNNQAYLDLAELYLNGKSAIHDEKMAFMYVLKAAQNNSTDAKRQLAEFYKKGIGVGSDLNIAKTWQDKANQDEKNSNADNAYAAVALWLSNGATDKLEQTAYQMNGILSAWSNPAVLGENTYNQTPKYKLLARDLLFKPEFKLVQPNEVPISVYYDALLTHAFDSKSNEWSYPLYPLNKQVANVERANSLIVAHPDLPAPYLDAQYTENDAPAEVMDLWTEGWQKQVNIRSEFYQLYNRAILGDAQAQFEIGQLFQYGIGITQNNDSAIVFYQNAVEQGHLGAEYNLAVLYLKNAKTKEDYQLAVDELTDAAFKGNKNSQYLLGKLLEKGLVGPDGVEYIQANPEQGVSLLYVAAANNYGPAEYELAERLAHQHDNGLSEGAKQSKNAIIRELYQGAADKGVANAYLPLAFYNAMEAKPEKQKEAFLVAQQQADAGDDKAALLLGLLYDRGIGVFADSAKARYWYQRAGQNAVSQFILGTYLVEGNGLEKNKTEGMALLQRAVDENFSYADLNLAVLKQQAGEEFLPQLVKAYDLGNSSAGIILADSYLAGVTDAQKMQQARSIYAGLAEKGDRDAQLKLAYMDEKGLGTNPDLASAQHWYTASAEQGNVFAQYLLGQLYQIGALGEPNYNLAKQWFQKASTSLPEASIALGFIDETVNDDYPQAMKAYEQAANKGDPVAMYNLALMYLYGKGTPVNYQKAKELFTQAANQNIHQAMNQLGSIYFKGLGQTRDEQLALTWFKKAADLGDANALYELGLLAETGATNTLQFADSLKYYQSAADKGNEKAMMALARMYHYGLGVAKDPKMAMNLYQKLAAHQNAYAQYQLGIYYLEGKDGELSPAKGKQLLQQASDNGNLQAKKVLQRLEAQGQARVSFIEPVLLNQIPEAAGQTANLMYLDALNVWNRGDELLSRMMLKQLVNQYPDFAPAKQVYEQVNNIKISRFKVTESL